MEHDKSPSAGDRTPESPEEAAVARLLRAAGERQSVPQEVTERVKEVVRESWEDTVGGRSPVRSSGWKVIWWAAAASVALAVGLWMTSGSGVFDREAVATVDSVDPGVRLALDGESLVRSAPSSRCACEEIE